MCLIDVDDPAELWFDTVRTARKSRPCSVCRCAILPGEMYLRNTYLADGEWSSAGTACHVCACLYLMFREAHGGGYGPERLEESLRECVEDSLWATEIWRDKDGAHRTYYYGRAAHFVEAKQRGRAWRDALAIINWRKRRARREARRLLHQHAVSEVR